MIEDIRQTILTSDFIFILIYLLYLGDWLALTLEKIIKR